MVLEFVEMIRSVSTLSVLLQGPHDLNLNHLLNAVDATNLTSLIMSPQGIYSEPMLALAPAIARFDRLVSLSLPANCHHPRLAASIAQLPKLESISFIYPSTPDFRALEAILTLPQFPPSLKSITIPVPYFCRGAFYLEPDYTITYDFDGRVVPDPTWEPPIWPESFTLAQAKELIVLTTRARVFFDSRLAEVIQASREYDDELAWCMDQPIVEWGSGQGLVFA